MSTLTNNERQEHLPESDGGIPKEDCLGSIFLKRNEGKFETSTDRQWVQWASQTESKVRFEKLESRGDHRQHCIDHQYRYFKNSRNATTLQSRYLIDLCPQRRNANSGKQMKAKFNDEHIGNMGKKKRAKFNDNKHFAGKQQRTKVDDEHMNEFLKDMEAFERTIHPSFNRYHQLDEDFLENAAKLDFTNYSVTEDTARRDGGKSDDTTGLFPQNLLFFQLILEGFVGYRFPLPMASSEEEISDAKKSSTPNGAIMGGAIVAALSSWPQLQSIFSRFPGETLTKDDYKDYIKWKRTIVVALNKFFRRVSDFKTGDVDIFIESSLQTKLLMQLLTDNSIGLSDNVLSHIEEYIGGCGFVNNDLCQFSKQICDDYLEKKPYALKNKTDFWGKPRSSFGFVYAQAKNSVSFMLGITKGGPPDEGATESSEDESLEDSSSELPEDNWSKYKNQAWPRTTQLIMLNEKADLLGGLMDFDISVVSCAYDGNGVWLTPRALFSLLSETQIVTPFVLNENRNRSRIAKYFKRGFNAYMIDPYCFHSEGQCIDKVDLMFHHYDDSISRLQRHFKWSSYGLRQSRYRQMCKEIKEYRENKSGPMFQCCCQVREGRVSSRNTSLAYTSPTSRSSKDYSIMVFEKEQDHAIEYFSKRFKWSDEDKHKVLSVPRPGRYACLECRQEYATQLLLQAAPKELLGEQEENIIHGETSYRHKDHYWFNPSFYGCGAFNSKYAGNKARPVCVLKSQLLAQQISERARYIHKNKTDEGFCHRYVYGTNLDKIHQEASHALFPSQKRSPVGLNPERFIANCAKCQKWLHQYEYGVKHCKECVDAGYV